MGTGTLIFKQAAAAALLAGLIACGQKSPDVLLQQAQAAAAKGDYPAAILDIKSALEQQPEMQEGRRALAHYLYRNGDYAASEVEWRKLLEKGEPRAQALPAVLRALNKQGQFRKVIEEASAERDSAQWPAEARAALRTAVAEAMTHTGQLSTAQQIVTALRVEQPGYAPVAVLDARMKAAAGDPDGALQVLAPFAERDADALALSATILWRAKGKLDDAAAQFDRALALEPRQLDVRASAVMLRLIKGDRAAAEQHLGQMDAHFPGSPLAKYLRARLEYTKGNVQAARELLQPMLKAASRDVSVLTFAGEIELRSKSYIQAESFFSKAVSLAPKEGAPRALLAETLLASGAPGRAMDVLKPSLDAKTTDIRLLGLAARAAMHQGDLGKAGEYLNQAAKASPDDVKVRTALALANVAAGNAEVGIAGLRAIADAGGAGDADVALAHLLLQKGAHADALAVLDRLDRKQADIAVSHELRARVLAVKGDTVAAKTEYERALAIDPALFSAAKGLVSLDLEQGNADAAVARLEAFVKSNPQAGHAMFELAALKASRSGKAEELPAAYQAAIAASPRDLALRLRVIQNHLAQGRARAAKEVAATAAADFNDNVDVLEALGRAQLVLGEHQEAASVFTKVAQQRPNSAAPYMALADAAAMAGDTRAVEAALRRGVSIEPRNPSVHQALIHHLSRIRRVPEALAAAAEFRRQLPGLPQAMTAEGDLRISLKDLPGAVASYRSALAASPNGVVAARLHVALLAQKNVAEADALAAKWVKERPGDAAFSAYLASLAMAKKDWAGAEAIYRAVLARSPQDAAALNNVAWLMAQQKRQGAVAMAEQAVAASLSAPEALDTLAVALLSEGRAADALRVARRVQAQLPVSAEARLTLAKALLANGQKDDAAAELQALKGTRFRGEGEVPALLGESGVK